MISLKPLFMFLAYNDISIKELSEKSGVSYVRLLEMRRKNVFTKNQLDKICNCLNLNIKDIMRYED